MRTSGRSTPTEFFAVDLPAAIERHPDLVELLAGLNLRPLRIEVDGRAWVLQRDAQGTPRVTGDGDTSLTLRLTADQLSDLVNDQITPVGLMTAGTLDLEPMRIGGLMDWWLVLRSLLDERPVHTSGVVDLPDDLGRSFTLDDDPAGAAGLPGQAPATSTSGACTRRTRCNASATTWTPPSPSTPTATDTAGGPR